MGKSRNLDLPQHEYDQGHYGTLPLASLPSGSNIAGQTFVNSGSSDWHTDYPVDLRDEGTHQGRVYVLNFAGSGVSATAGSGVGTITITGGGSGSSSLTVREEDGSPSVSDVTILEFDGAVVSDEGGGVALVTVTASGSGVDDHGDLTGLQEDDHLIYLRNTLGEQHTISVLITSSSNETLDLVDGNVHDVTLNSDVALALTGAVSGLGCFMYIILRQDDVGSRDVTWPAGVQWINDNEPVLETDPDTWNWVSLFTADGGVIWYGDAGMASGSSFGTIDELDDIGDVNAPSPNDGEVLLWDAANSEWIAGSVSGSSVLGSNLPREVDYVQITSNVSPTATTEGSADIVVTANSVSFDGSTVALVEFFAPNVRPTASAAATMTVVLFEDGSSIGSWAITNSQAANSGNRPMHLVRRLTPSAGSHTYSVRAFVSSGTGLIGADTGGAGVAVPAYIRISKLDGGSNTVGPVDELDDIGDVNAPSPGDGDVLMWSASAGEWVANTPASSAGASDRVVYSGSNITTTNTSFEDASPLSITLNTGANRVMLALAAVGNNSNAGQTIFTDFEVDGTRIGNVTNGITSVTGSEPRDLSMSALTDILSAGSHTFKVKIRVTANTGALQAGGSDRAIVFSAHEIGGTGSGIVRVVKTADETVNNSSSIQPDDELTVPVSASKRYGWRANLFFSSSTTPDIKWEFRVPASATGQFAGMGLGTGGADNEGPTYAYGVGGGTTDAGNGVGVVRHRRFEGFLKTAGTAGSLDVYWAQNSANATDTVVYEGSTLEIWEL